MPKPTKARASFVAGSGTKCPRELAEPVQLIRIAPESNTLVVSSVQACTKGIWIWGAPIHHEAGAAAVGAPSNLLLIDTEGLSSIEQTEGHDAKIFCLAILLCPSSCTTRSAPSTRARWTSCRSWCS